MLRLGLSAHQVEVYLTLLQRGPLGAAELAAATSVPRTSVYELTKTLQEQGLVAATLDTPTRFRALPIREFVEYERQRLRAQETEIAKRLPELERLLRRVQRVDGDGMGATGSISTLRGANVVQRKVAAVLGGAEREVLVWLGRAAVPRLNAQLVELCKAGLDVRVMQHMEDGSLNPGRRMIEAGAALRHSAVPAQLTTFVVDGRECVMAFPPNGDGARHPTAGLWTDEQHFAEAQALGFQGAWAKAVPFGDRQRELARGDAPRTADLATGADPEANERVFLAAATGTFGRATKSLDMVLPVVAPLAFDREALLGRLKDVRVRLLVPVPTSEADQGTLARLGAVAEVREAPPALCDQTLIVADADHSLFATLARADAPGRKPHWESIIVSNQHGVVAAGRTYFEALWATAPGLAPSP